MWLATAAAPVSTSKEWRNRECPVAVVVATVATAVFAFAFKFCDFFAVLQYDEQQQNHCGVVAKCVACAVFSVLCKQSKSNKRRYQ